MAHPPLPYRYHAGTLPLASRVECVMEPGGVRQARPMIPGADGEATRTTPEASPEEIPSLPQPGGYGVRRYSLGHPNPSGRSQNDDQ